MQIIKVALFLTIICCLSAASLSSIEKLTSPVIKSNQEKQKLNSLKILIKGARIFEDITHNDSTLIVGKDSHDKILGYVQEVRPSGYAGPVTILVGMDELGKVTGISVENLSETPGLGTKIREKWFKDQFRGLTSSSLLKVKKDGGTIDSITAATVSSRAVCRGVKKALTIVDSLLKKSEKESEKDDVDATTSATGKY